MNSTVKEIYISLLSKNLPYSSIDNSIIIERVSKHLSLYSFFNVVNPVRDFMAKYEAKYGPES